MLARLALAALFVLLPITTNAEGPAPKPPELALESYRLPNGLKVALHRDPTVPRVIVCVAYHVGSKNEKAGRTGFAHFFEHMMFRGTRHVPNYDIPLQEAGASSNAFTSEDMTVYFETVPANYLERALYLEAERLAFLPADLKEAAFDTEREVVKNERRQTFEIEPYGLDSPTLSASVFPKSHPYSWSVIGSMEDLNKATLNDLKQFFAEFYHPGNATLCLVGDFDTAEAKSLILKYFGPLSSIAGLNAVPSERTRRDPEILATPAVKPTKIVRHDEVTLPRVYWAWPTVRDDHPDSPALELLADVLAGGEASRLHKALVLESRLSQDVSAESDTKEIAGLFVLESTAVTPSEPEKSLARIETAFTSALEDLQAHPPTEEERARVLATYESQAYSSMTPLLGRAIVLASGFAQKNDPAEYQKDFARHFKVTTDDLKRVAAQYLKPEKVVLWTEPLAKDQSKTPEIPAGPTAKESETVVPTREPAKGPDWSKMPGPGTAVAFKAPKFSRKKLSNGLDVWIAAWKTLPRVSVRLVIPAGTADDPRGKSGLAALTASLLDKGTTSLTATELTEKLQALGVTLGAGATSDATSTGFPVIKRHLEPALAILSEVLTSPRFDPKDFERERDLQLSALKQGPNSVGWIARRAFPALLYGADHPYGKPGDGSIETVKKLTLDDVKAFHANHLGAKGAILIVVGDVESEPLLASLEATLGKWGPQKLEPAKRPATTVKAEPESIYFVDKPGAVQSVLSVGRHWVDRSDPTYFATMIGNRIFGGDFLSRINNNLREVHGFTYGAGSSFTFRRSGSVWSVGTQVRTDATAEALRETLKELAGLAGSKPFTAEEISTALNAELKSYPETFESPGSIAGTLEEMARFQLPIDYLDSYLSLLQATPPEAIAKVMARIVEPEERVILIVGDRKSVEPKLKELGFKKLIPVSVDGVPTGNGKAK